MQKVTFILFVLSTSLFCCIECLVDFDAGDVLSNCVNERTCACCESYSSCFRTLDGSCNNIQHSVHGASKTRLFRVLNNGYVDLLHTPRGFPNHASHDFTPSSNDVSQALFDVVEQNSQDNKQGLSTMFMSFGQFIDHDMSLTPISPCAVQNCENIPEAFKYPCYPITFAGETTCTRMGRSVPICQDSNLPRAFINQISSFIDGSQIYHNDRCENDKLRAYNGRGLMKIQEEDGLLFLLPEEECNLSNGCSLVGEERGDENIALNGLHTLWVREHNRIASALRVINPHWNEPTLFETTRKIVGAILQRITYNEYLPYLVDMPSYGGYRPDINPAISVSFSTAAYRFGHSLVPNAWAQLDANFDPVAPDLPIRFTLNNITTIRNDGIEPTLFGLLANQSQGMDMAFAHGIARTLFIPPTATGYRDLTALNIQRGRDHGVPSYGEWRELCGLTPFNDWSDLNGNIFPDAIPKLQALYDTPNDIDLYAGGVGELHVPGSLLGPTFHCIVRDQFLRTRDGDRFFYKRDKLFSESQLNEIMKVTLSKVLCNNLQGAVSLQENAFQAFNAGAIRRECGAIPDMDFEAWRGA